MQFSDALDLYQKTNIFIRLNTEWRSKSYNKYVSNHHTYSREHYQIILFRLFYST